MAGKRSKQEHVTGNQQCQMAGGSAVSLLLAVATSRRIRTQLLIDHCLQPKKVFEFLKLPAEIRNRIYWNVLVKKYDCYGFRQHPLTLTNKQIRSESLPMLYGNSLFSIFVWRHDHTFGQLQGLWPMSPAMTNLSHITRLDIGFSLELRGPFRDLTVGIYMRKDESGGAYLWGKELVGRPGLEWKDRASIKNVCDCLVMDSLLAGNQFQLMTKWIPGADKRMDRMARGLLFFAERCPAAAEWVWMGLEDTPEIRAVGFNGDLGSQ